MSSPGEIDPLRVLILAPIGRDAALAANLLGEVGIAATPCDNLHTLTAELEKEAGAVLVIEEALRSSDLSSLRHWLEVQPAWSDMPIIVLTQRGGGPERNPGARRLSLGLGNVSFLERPFHPTTVISQVNTALRSRRRQYEARERIETIRAAEEALRQANAGLEQRVDERTARLLEAEAALRQSQKLEAIGQLTGGVAHDFNNLLMVILGGLEVMDHQKDPARRERIVRGMRQAAERGAKLTKQLLAFSRIQALQAEPVDLVRHVESMRTLLDHALSGDVAVQADMPGDLWPVEVDPNELELVILNLCVNARDAMPGGGVVRIHARNQFSDGDGDFVRLCITDTGTGMSEEVRARAFEPFYTTKDIGKGSGLGLAQVYGFAQQSGGSVEIESEPGKGASIVLLLPRYRGTTLPEHEAPVKEPRRGAGEHVLLVEDDEAVARVVCDMLANLGYKCRHVPTAAAALEVLNAEAAIEIMLSDVMMPGGMNGVELADEARRVRPGLPVVLTSGFAAAFEASARAVEVQLLSKPFTPDDLAQGLHGALTRASA